MQDKDKALEMIQGQRRRRKRIARIKSAIVGVLVGWIALSLLLIILLFVKVLSLERRLDGILQSTSGAAGDEEYLNGSRDGDLMEGMGETKAGALGAEALLPSMEAGTEEQEEGILLYSDLEAADNLAEDGDIHKVYLTFDDGPSERTGEILDILAQYGVKATFFVAGKEDDASKALYRRIADEGHTLGMHSYCNKYGELYQSEEAFADDYQKLKAYLYEETGTECRYYRFPGGSSNQISDVPMSSLIQYLNEQGTIYCDWNVSSGDVGASEGAEGEIVENVVTGVEKYKTSIVLLHDSADQSATVEALGPLIEELQGMGAELLPIDESTTVIQYVRIAGND